MPGVEWKSGQLEALAALDRFLAGPDHVFMLKGYAGTGKTTLVSEVCRRLYALERSFFLMAPTGRAARVLAHVTKYPASTIHRKIYSFSEAEADYLEVESGRFQLVFGQVGNQDDANAVYIVDEASMVSDRRTVHEFLRFGTGKLLKDLFHYVDINTGGDRKVVFVGDPAQLPPVGENISPALTHEYLLEEYGIACREHELTEVVRQEEGGILRCAHKLRQAIHSGRYHEIDFDDGLPEICEVEEEDVLSRYLEISEQRPSARGVIITYSNRQVFDYNNLVRQHFFPNISALAPGDIVVVAANSYAYGVELMNGDFGRVLEVSEAVERPPKPVFVNTGKSGADGKPKSQRVELVFRKAVIRFRNRASGFVNIDCRIIENLLFSDQRELTPLETKGLYVDFRNRHPDLKPRTPDFKEALINDPYFNCLRIKFGYAVTCHKAQGGEWDRIIVDFEHSGGKLNEFYFRWAYTAMTRARKGLYAVHTPRVGLIPQAELVTPLSDVPDQVGVLQVPESVLEQGTDPFAAALEHIVRERLREARLELQSVMAHPYQLKVRAGRGNEVVPVMLYWNRQGAVTNVRLEKPMTGNVPQLVLQALNSLCKQRLGVLPPAAPAAAVTSRCASEATSVMSISHPKFFAELGKRLNGAGMTLHELDEKTQFHVHCTVMQGPGCAVLNYYFNGAGRCTRVLPDVAKSNDMELLNQVLGMGGE